MTGPGRSLAVTYIRACTLLIRLDGLVVVTDPWFSMRMRFLPALRRPGIPLAAMPKADLILCSHLHADHFEKRALSALADGRTVVAGPRGTAKQLPRTFPGTLLELAPGEETNAFGLELRAYPMRHTFPPPEELGFAVKGDGRAFFFAGDAAYSGAFGDAGRQHQFDAALLPVGGSRIWGRRTVMDPAGAVRAATDLGAKVMIPTHPGGDWPPLPPLSWHPGTFAKAVEAARKDAPGLRVAALAPGETAVL